MTTYPQGETHESYVDTETPGIRRCRRPRFFGHRSGGSASTTPGSSAQATVSDTQTSTGNYVLNQGTVNTASLESSLDDAAGNVGVNIAGGDHNQQANSAALSTADEFFVFGTATASVNLNQTGTNVVDNYSVTNSASVLDSGNNASGNIGINVASGVFNQQKNDFATATAGGFVATASSTATQSSTGNITNNRAVLTESATVALTLDGNVTGTYSGISDQVGDVYLEVWDGALHPNGTVQLGHVDVDSDTQVLRPAPTVPAPSCSRKAARSTWLAR